MHPYERMSCGHFARYEFIGESGESLCVMCELRKAQAEIDRLRDLLEKSGVISHPPYPICADLADPLSGVIG